LFPRQKSDCSAPEQHTGPAEAGGRHLIHSDMTET
jgi:hypothetical protein